MKNQLFGKITNEFRDHLQNHQQEQFALSSVTSKEFSELARDLERKRQEGILTQNEREELKTIDEWIEKIANFNQEIQHQSSSQESFEKVYNLDGKSVQPADFEESNDPVVIPHVSDAQADDIIKGLNEQFQQKVMSKIDMQDGRNKDKAAAIADDLERPEQDQKKGPNINEYISNIRHDLPTTPFSDSDSEISLSDMAERMNLKQNERS